MIDLDKQLLTRDQYNNLSPFEQGFASYWQAARNTAIPDACPYGIGTPDHFKWQQGQQAAVVAAIDIED